MQESALAVLERSFRPLAIPQCTPVNGEKRICGIYALIRRDAITYIGSSSNVVCRVWMHCVSNRSSLKRRSFIKEFDRIIWYPVERTSLLIYEGALIRFFGPMHNAGGTPRDQQHDDEVIASFGLSSDMKAETTIPSRVPKSAGRSGNRGRFRSSPIIDRTERKIHNSVIQIVNKSGASSQELADMIGCSEQRIRRLLNGMTRITARDMYDLSLALGVPLSDLFGGEPSPGKAINQTNLPVGDIAWLEVA